MGRSAILGEQRNNDFIDVCCGHGELKDYTYAITKSGLLCEFNNRRLLDRWVELKVIINYINVLIGTVILFIPQIFLQLSKLNYLPIISVNMYF